VNQNHGWVGFEDGLSPRFLSTVEKYSVDGMSYYRKNRSTKIEELFSGSSAFAKIWSRFLGFQMPGAVISPGQWLGFSEDLSKHSRFSPALRNASREYARAGGAWLSLSTLVGITDITAEDVVLLELDDQTVVPFPIDLEGIFSPIRMGSETGWLTGGLNAGLSTAYQPREPEILLDSFLRNAEALIPVLPELIIQLEHELETHPIRVSLRPKSAYLPYIQGKKRLAEVDIPFLVEERIALKAGQIPYFFTEIYDDQLFTVSQSGRIETVNLQHLESVWARVRPDSSAVIGVDRLHQVLKLTALQIARAYFPKEENKTLCGETFEFNVSDSKIFLKTKRFSVGTELSS